MEKTLPLHATGKEHHHQQKQWRASLDALWASHKIPIILLYYGLASSTLIVINKLAVHSVRAPVFILAAQLLFAAGVVRGSAAAGLVEVEPLRWTLVKPFTLIILGFLGTLYSNIKVGHPWVAARLLTGITPRSNATDAPGSTCVFRERTACVCNNRLQQRINQPLRLCCCCGCCLFAACHRS
jgi:hypothetical protein